MTFTIPSLTSAPVVEVTIIEDVADAEPCYWQGSTGRMRPTRIRVTYTARVGAPQWWFEACLEGPAVRKDGRDGKAIAHQIHYREQDWDNCDRAPQWVLEFVRLNEPPASMRGM